MSNKQLLRFEKYKHFIVHYFKYCLHLFKPSTVLGSGIFSTYKFYSEAHRGFVDLGRMAIYFQGSGDHW